LTKIELQMVFVIGVPFFKSVGHQYVFRVSETHKFSTIALATIRGWEGGRGERATSGKTAPANQRGAPRERGVLRSAGPWEGGRGEQVTSRRTAPANQRGEPRGRGVWRSAGPWEGGRCE